MNDNTPSNYSAYLLDILRPPTREELERILRPAPTNPATHEAKGGKL